MVWNNVATVFSPIIKAYTGVTCTDKNGQNGLVDTICYLLSDYKKQNKQILAGLLYAFKS